MRVGWIWATGGRCEVEVMLDVGAAAPGRRLRVWGSDRAGGGAAGCVRWLALRRRLGCRGGGPGLEVASGSSRSVVHELGDVLVAAWGAAAGAGRVGGWWSAVESLRCGWPCSCGLGPFGGSVGMAVLRAKACADFGLVPTMVAHSCAIFLLVGIVVELRSSPMARVMDLRVKTQTPGVGGGIVATFLKAPPRSP